MFVWLKGLLFGKDTQSKEPECLWSLVGNIGEEVQFSTARAEGGALSLRRIRRVVADAEWEKQRELCRDVRSPDGSGQD